MRELLGMKGTAHEARKKNKGRQWREVIQLPAWAKSVASRKKRTG